MANSSALLAMFGLMLDAFVTACLTNLRAQSYQRIGRFGIACNKARRGCAKFGAVNVQFNAPCHHRNVFFIQTSCHATIAFRRAK